MDSFEISLRLRHLSLDPNEISRAFDLKPRFSHIAGNTAGTVVRKWSVWHGTIAEGAGSDEYEEALKRSVLLLETARNG
jgi:hypothetical protein